MRFCCNSSGPTNLDGPATATSRSSPPPSLVEFLPSVRVEHMHLEISTSVSGNENKLDERHDSFCSPLEPQVLLTDQLDESIERYKVRLIAKGYKF
jgi:hypothetical protein